MSEAYEEIIHGESIMRSSPGERHELICARLHGLVGNSLSGITTTRLLQPRSVIQLSAGTLVRPDLAMITVAGGKLWLAAEIINSEDHRADTVIKKCLYEEMNLPRLWMIDCRYDNVEIYCGTPHGLALKGILAGKEKLTEALLPELDCRISDLFAPLR